MTTLIALTALGILTLLLGVLKRHRWLIPVILTGLIVSVVLTLLDWNKNLVFFSRMVVFDNLAVAFSALMIFSAFLIFCFAPRYYRGVQRPMEDVFGVMIFALVGAVMMTSFGNLIILFLGIETLSIALYVLAGSHKEAITSNEATLKYFLLGSFLSGFLLFGIALIYGASGSFDLPAIRQYVAQHGAEDLPAMFRAGLFLLIIGLAFKMAVVPFHFWAPDVYEGTPTLLTAYMATIVKTASIVAMFRFFSQAIPEIGGVWMTTIWILAAMTILTGNLTGLYQPNLKRMLAYSSISHSGYMLIAIVASGSMTASALLLYALSYSIATIIAFGILILVREAYGNDYFSSMNGMSKTNPLEAVCLTIAMLSLTGIPPLAGFFAKYFLFTTALQQGYLWLVLIAITGSAVSLGFYFKPIIAIYLKEPAGGSLMAGPGYKIHLVAMTILLLLIGFLPFWITGLL